MSTRRKKKPCVHRRPRRAKKTRRTSTKRVTRSSPAGPTIYATKLGEVRSIVYRHGDGNLYRHAFKSGTFLAQSSDGKFLIIGPVSVKPFIT